MGPKGLDRAQSYREINESPAWNGIVALCHTNQAEAFAEEIFG